MRPPICDVCGEGFEPSEGDLLRFADYEPLPEGMVGHPDGLLWICGEHLEEAKGLTHLSGSAAVEELAKNGS